jgi:hypothetical protein
MAVTGSRRRGGVMQRKTVLAAALIGFALVAASCGAAAEKLSEEAVERALESSGGGDVELDVSGDGDEFTVNVESEDGTFSVGSDVEIPGELQIPVPDGGSATSAGTQEGAVFASIAYPLERYDELVAFYDNWTSGTGDEWDTSTATFDMDGQTQRSASWAETGVGSYIAVNDCFDVFGDTDSDTLNAACVTINESE